MISEIAAIPELPHPWKLLLTQIRWGTVFDCGGLALPLRFYCLNWRAILHELTVFPRPEWIMFFYASRWYDYRRVFEFLANRFRMPPSPALSELNLAAVHPVLFNVSVGREVLPILHAWLGIMLGNNLLGRCSLNIKWCNKRYIVVEMRGQIICGFHSEQTF